MWICFSIHIKRKHPFREEHQHFGYHRIKLNIDYLSNGYDFHWNTFHLDFLNRINTSFWFCCIYSYLQQQALITLTI
jgi:hypothetical protein